MGPVRLEPGSSVQVGREGGCDFLSVRGGGSGGGRGVRPGKGGAGGGGVRRASQWRAGPGPSPSPPRVRPRGPRKALGSAPRP